MVTVYALRCTETQEAYVGCTAGKLGKRMREHRCLLNGKKHSASRLQILWDRYGPAGFRMEVLESLPAEAGVVVKRERELFWMREYSRRGMLLNQHEISYQPPTGAQAKATAVAHMFPGNRWTPEANLKRRLAQLGKPKGHGAKISATKRRARAMR